MTERELHLQTPPPHITREIWNHGELSMTYKQLSRPEFLCRQKFLFTAYITLKKKGLCQLQELPETCELFTK